MFEWCLDAEEVTLEILSDDYLKVITCANAANVGTMPGRGDGHIRNSLQRLLQDILVPVLSRADEQLGAANVYVASRKIRMIAEMCLVTCGNKSNGFSACWSVFFANIFFHCWLRICI
jgi:hypothetical protein